MIGDFIFVYLGIIGIVDVVYNGFDIFVMILDNLIIGMIGY